MEFEEKDEKIIGKSQTIFYGLQNKTHTETVSEKYA
jgi:hypothetical protein